MAKSKPAHHPHDTFFKQSFSDLTIVIDYILKYLPRFEYVLTNMADWTDERILSMKAGLLTNIMLLFKHHGENNYIQRNFDLFFYKLESLLKSSADRNIIRKLVVYLLKTTEIEEEDLKELIGSLPTKTKDMTMSSYNMLIAKGEEIGIAKGEEIGIAKGEEIGIQKEKETVVRNFLESDTFKEEVLSMEQLAEIAGVNIAYVLALKKVMDEEKFQNS